MAYDMTSPLCGSCKAVTFTMLLYGFVHSKPFADAVVSGRTCKLCRLMVCMYSKLQLESPWSPYEVEKRYDMISDSLLSLPAVRRWVVGREDLPYFQTLARPVEYLSWNRREYMDFILGPKLVLTSGNFGGGSTIQVNACEDSYYHLSDMVPLRDVTACTASRNYTMLRKWMKNCMETHIECRPLEQNSVSDPSCESVTLPTRLVDVGSPDGEICPFLVETEGKQGSYLTLSHRWGKRQNYKTTKDNIECFKQALPQETLPRTFKDAIMVTRQLGFQYIWIDSLCIIQDDNEDWLRESEKMGDIFASSSCTLAVVHALDDDSNDQGLFPPHNDALAVRICCPFSREAVPKASAKIRNAAGRDFVWKYKWLKKEHGEDDVSNIIRHNTIVLRPRIVSLPYKMKQSEWYNRGWVFQERVLSRRIIYYTGDKVYWDCFQEQGDEQGVEIRQTSRNALISPKNITAHTAQSFAEMLAMEYSTCQLTKRKDNLPAILGVCNKFRDYGQAFYAGILDDGTGQSLLWHAYEDSMPQYKDFHAPSWTWIGRSGKPSYYIPWPHEATSRSLTNSMSFQTRTYCDSNNSYGLCEGTCTSGDVSLVAPIGELFRYEKLYDMEFEGFDGPIERAPNQLLIWVLGSGVHRLGVSIPRYDIERGITIYSPRNLFLPRHTEFLQDSGCIIGYFVPDVSRSNNEPISVICAGVQLWESNGSLERPYGGHVEGYGYNQEKCIDIIGLEKLADTPTRYRRIGRGRIICNAWLGQCTEKKITIV